MFLCICFSQFFYFGRHKTFFFKRERAEWLHFLQSVNPNLHLYGKSAEPNPSFRDQKLNIPYHKQMQSTQSVTLEGKFIRLIKLLQTLLQSSLFWRAVIIPWVITGLCFYLRSVDMCNYHEATFWMPSTLYLKMGN